LRGRGHQVNIHVELSTAKRLGTGSLRVGVRAQFLLANEGIHSKRLSLKTHKLCFQQENTQKHKLAWKRDTIPHHTT